jgi:hypothetical protein
VTLDDDWRNIVFYKPEGRASLCDKTLAVPAGGSRVMIFLQSTDVDGIDPMVVLYDAMRGVVDDVIPSLGAGEPVITPHPGGVLYRELAKPSDGMIGACDPEWFFPSGDKKLPIWWIVTSRNGKLVKALDRTRTWVNFPDRKFFKTRDGFEKSFGVDHSRDIVSKRWYYTGVTSDKKEGIYPSANREVSCDQQDWIFPYEK